MNRSVVAFMTLVLLTSCNEHVFQRVIPITTRVVVPTKKIDIDRAADILFIIDNSGSMAEEQENLAVNASSSSSSSPPNACDSSGFTTLRSYIDSHPEQTPDEWPQNINAIFAECGFIERLQLYKNHFHIGVITTDMHDCDNVHGNGPRPSTPQRGCLQTSSQDPTLKVLDWQTPDLANKFANIVRNVGVVGSAWEQGLMSTQHFLTPNGVVSPRSAAAGTCSLSRDCSGDLTAFLRSREVNASGDEVETKLVVIFLTDEEDCSNNNTIDEAQPGSTELCYSQPELLVDSQPFVAFFRGLKSNPDLVTMGLIAGLYDSGSGMTPAGCRSTSSGPTSICDESGGNSIVSCSNSCGPTSDQACCAGAIPLCACHTEAVTCEGTLHPAANCCQADAAKRYFSVVTQMSSYKVDTLCSNSYKDTMIAIANLINETGIVVLPEVPADPDQLVVKMRGPRWPGGEWQNVPRYDESTGLPAEGGFSLIDENTRIKFFNQWVPQPGDEIQVMFLGS